MYCKTKKKKLIAIPTTGAGASETEWAVIWNSGGRKCSSKCERPLSFLPEFEVNLRTKDRENTAWDIYAHFLESGISECSEESILCLAIAKVFLKSWDIMDDDDLITYGMIGGLMIGKYGTNLYHAMSYPITAIYGVPHGRALKYVFTKLPKRFKRKDKDRIIAEALTYPKIHKSTYGTMTAEKLKGILKW